MKIIVGLGNPGHEYKTTRHNAGFLAIDELTSRLGLSWSVNKKCQADLAKTDETILVKPLTFMNDSGRAVRAVLSYYHLLPKKFGLFTAKGAELADKLIIIHDDIDLALGNYRISVDSRSAGHKGVQSIIDYLRTKNFTRLRLGIRAAQAEKMPTDKFVLQKFGADEIMTLQQAVNRALSEKIFKF
jgi:PTH1 family peptidyl-tRNA hydrolase